MCDLNIFKAKRHYYLDIYLINTTPNYLRINIDKNNFLNKNQMNLHLIYIYTLMKSVDTFRHLIDKIFYFGIF